MKKYIQSKKRTLTFLLIFLLTVAVLYFSLKDNFSSVVEQFFKLNIFWLIGGFLLVICYWYFISLSMYLIAKKVSNKITVRKCFKINTITNFFSAITPFSSGGQPYQIYALKNENIDIANCANISVQNFVAYQISLIFLGTVAIICNHIFKIFEDVSLIKTLVLIGYLVNLLVAIVLFAISFTQKLNRFILKIIIILGSKLKIVKDKDKTIEQFNNYVSRFHDSTKLLLKDKANLVKIILCNIGGLVCFYLVPLMILYSTGDFTSFNVGIAIITSAYVMIIGAFVPLPGGTGGLEYSFVAFFGNFVSGGKLTIIMLMWRFITYYFGMIVGAIMLNFARRKE